MVAIRFTNRNSLNFRKIVILFYIITIIIVIPSSYQPLFSLAYVLYFIKLNRRCLIDNIHKLLYMIHSCFLCIPHCSVEYGLFYLFVSEFNTFILWCIYVRHFIISRFLCKENIYNLLVYLFVRLTCFPNSSNRFCCWMFNLILLSYIFCLLKSTTIHAV